MIAIDDALDDLKKIETENEGALTVKVFVSAMKVFLKMLSTIRSNQLLTEEDKKALKVKRQEKDTKKS